MCIRDSSNGKEYESNLDHDLYQFCEKSAVQTLRAAAPELYEALVKMVRLADGHFSGQLAFNDIDQAKAALSKALGETG